MENDDSHVDEKGQMTNALHRPMFSLADSSITRAETMQAVNEVYKSVKL